LKTKYKIECPGCGKQAIVDIADDTRYMEFECPKCTTSFSITFKTDEENNLMSFLLARDVEG